jgi:hypothetical protein
MVYSKHKILVITSSVDDYLTAGLLHGLKSILLPEQVIDFPKCESLYHDGYSASLYGRGFTIFGLISDDLVDRWGVYDRVIKEEFSLIIFADIHRSFGIYLQLSPYLTYENTVILDGADTPQLYPYAGKWWRYPSYWLLPKAHKNFRYFKREWTPETIWNLWYQIPPRWLCKYISAPKNLYPISFSIPEEKIVKDLPVKTKLFPKHIVDHEVASQVAGSVTSYAFESEADYYADLQAAKFGITTKRSGWDCLRHYEIAANGCVPCFRDLGKKPHTCAPHGLDETNCITYHSYTDLMDKIQSVSDTEYETLQKNAFSWVKSNTTIQMTKQLLEDAQKNNLHTLL